MHNKETYTRVLTYAYTRIDIRVYAKYERIIRVWVVRIYLSCTVFIFLDIFSKVSTYLHLQLSLLLFVFLDKKDLRLIAFVFYLAGQSCLQFHADSHARRLLFPSFLLALIMHSCVEIQYGRQQIVFSVRKFLPPQQDLCKKTVSSIAFLNCCWVFYMFSEKIGTANLQLLSPSSLVQFSPDKKSSQHILAREAMKVAGETWQRSRRTSPADGSYIQPCLRDQPVVQPKCSLILCCGLKEVATKSRVRVYFEQPILALLLVQLVTQQICSCCTTSQ